ncbi:MAG: insulinase family protein [bacterium]
MTNVLRHLRKRVSQLFLPKGGRWLPAGVAIVCLLSPVAAVGADDVPSAIEIRSHAFANGLVLYHARVEEATTFMLSATVWVGSVDEDPKNNGSVSHLLEHMLFHQPDLSETEFKAQIESVGGWSNASTSQAKTSYYVNLPASRLTLGQQWLHTVLFHDQLVTDRLNEEKEIVNREVGWSDPTWWQRIGDMIRPSYLELPRFWEVTFGLPAYDRPVSGTYRVAQGLTATQLEAHYRQYYYPENMVLLYVGPHPLDAVTSALQASFASAPPTGHRPNLRSVVETVSPRAAFDHWLPFLLSDPKYSISIGHVFTGLRFSQFEELFFYRYVLQQVLEERFRYGQGKAYAVTSRLDSYRGAGYVQFDLESGPEQYWQQLEEVKNIVWGDLGTYLNQKDYERYKSTLAEQLARVREVTEVHRQIVGRIALHPVHRPAPEEVSLSGPPQTLSYEEFLRWVKARQGQTAPLLELSMPVVPFPYAHGVLFVFAIGIGVGVSKAVLRRSFPREPIALMAWVPYGPVGWIQHGLWYAVAASFFWHANWGIDYAMLGFGRVDALALVDPYLKWITGGFLLGLAIVLAGLVMPRKVLVTSGGIVLKMRSPLFFRIPIHDIGAVEVVSLWRAWREVLRLRALPLYPWFLRGLLIHRKSGRPVLLHTKDDDGVQAALSAHLGRDRAGAPVHGQVATETRALEPCPVGPLRSAG